MTPEARQEIEDMYNAEHGDVEYVDAEEHDRICSSCNRRGCWMIAEVADTHTIVCKCGHEEQI